MSTASSLTGKSTKLLASRCFKLAALLNMTAIPGHHVTGLISVFPAVQSIPDVPQHAVGQRAAMLGWDFLHSFFLVEALLNYQWSKFNRPRTREERWMIWGNLLWGFINGCRCFEKAGNGPYFAAFGPLTVLWIAPMLTAAGQLLS